MVYIKSISTVHTFDFSRDGYDNEQLEYASRDLALKVQKWLKGEGINNMGSAKVQICQSVCKVSPPIGAGLYVVSTTAFIMVEV